MEQEGEYMRYKHLQIMKHALQHYIKRPGASEKDLAGERALLRRVEDRIQWTEEAYGILPKKERMRKHGNEEVQAQHCQGPARRNGC